MGFTMEPHYKRILQPTQVSGRCSIRSRLGSVGTATTAFTLTHRYLSSLQPASQIEMQWTWKGWLSNRAKCVYHICIHSWIYSLIYVFSLSIVYWFVYVDLCICLCDYLIAYSFTFVCMYLFVYSCNNKTISIKKWWWKCWPAKIVTSTLKAISLRNKQEHCRWTICCGKMQRQTLRTIWVCLK